MRLFLFGTLRWPDLLATVAGRAVSVAPARLPGHAVARAAGGDWPVLVPGEVADGIVTEPLDDDALMRLDWYEAGHGYGRRAITVETAEGPVAAEAYMAEDDGHGPWDLDAWIAAHGARTALAAGEIMAARTRASAETGATLRGMIHARAASELSVRAHCRPATVGAGLTAADVEPLGTAHPYLGFHRVDEMRFRHARFDGSTAGPITRAVSVVAQAATVLPWDPARDRVLVVEQIRAGALALGDPLPWMLEPVAGLIDPGEDPATTAVREAQEEAGIALDRDALALVSRYYPSPGGLGQVLWSYVARCDLPDGAAGLGGLAGEAEDIRGHLVPVDDLLDMVESGEAANAPLVISAQWIALRRG